MISRVLSQPEDADARPLGLEQLVSEALCVGADALEVEYRDGHEEVVAMKGAFGVLIACLSANDATGLRNELVALLRRNRRMVVDDGTVEVRAHTFESFGEQAFRVEFKQSGRHA